MFVKFCYVSSNRVIKLRKISRMLTFNWNPPQHNPSHQSIGYDQLHIHDLSDHGYTVVLLVLGELFFTVAVYKS